MRRQPPIEFTTMPLQPSFRLPGWSLLVLVLAWLLPGSLGHAPWRGDDLLYIALSANTLRTGQFWLPELNGLPLYDVAPWHIWGGAVFGKLFGWLLPLHDAIRLYTLSATFFFLWALRRCARGLISPDSKGNATLLLSVGSIGLLLHAHEAQAQISLLAASAACLWGCSELGSNLRRGSLILGASVGISFLAGGFNGLILTLPVSLCALWPHKNRWQALCPGLLLALALLLIWPISFAQHNPTRFTAWFDVLCQNALPNWQNKKFSNLISMLAWFTWPLWPVVGWVIWKRRQQLHTPAYLWPLVHLCCALWVVTQNTSIRPSNLLPVLPALILLTASELTRLRRGAINWLDWFAIITFTLLGVFIWLSWSGLHVQWPEALGRNVARQLPGFTPKLHIFSTGIAALLSAAWLYTLLALPRFNLRAATRWALGITLAWGLAASLWIDWFDYDRNYTQTLQKLSTTVKQHGGTCLFAPDVGRVQRAAFDYFTDLTLVTDPQYASACSLALSYASGKNALQAPETDWQLLTSINKGRGRFQEKFALYQRGNTVSKTVRKP